MVGSVESQAVVRGRYAPSPTGELHLGNASSALLGWLSVRAAGGIFVMRMEDLDRNRVRRPLGRQILDDLVWLGLDWDEGCDVGGPHGPYDQSSRLGLHHAALETLRSDGRLYPCFCSRRDIAAAASAPQEPGDELRYGGTCARLSEDESRGRLQRGDRHAWRFRVEGRSPIFVDLVHGPWSSSEPTGDFVVYRADEMPAYQLAVVVDDAAMGINEVVRGDDLLSSTVRQLLLYEALGHESPTFGHVPLLLGPDGVRLSKRHQDVTLCELRARGVTPQQIVGRLACLHGLQPTPEPVAASELVPGFSLDRIRATPGGIRIDPAEWMR